MDPRYGPSSPPGQTPFPATQHAQDGPSRRRMLQPPTINTEFSDSQHLGHAYGFTQTPSTPRTALSTSFSPWEGSNTSNTSSLSSPASRLAPPMATRRGQSPMVPYNPQEWQRDGSAVGRGYASYTPSSRVGAAGHGLRDASGNEALLPSPPPPYSPNPTNTVTHSAHTTPQVGIGAFPQDPSVPRADGQYGSGNSVASLQRHSPSNYPISAPSYQASSSVHNSPVPSSGPAFPPPPPRAGQRDHSASRSGSSRLLSALTGRSRQHEQSAPPNAIEALSQNTNDALMRGPGRPPNNLEIVTSHEVLSQSGYHASSVEPLSGRAPGARRAASTGTLGIVSPSESDGSGLRSPTRLAGWEPGMPLPPPPPGPPPTSRSQSTSRVSERMERSGSSSDPSTTAVSAPAPRRPNVNAPPMLSPIPPTPADWVEEQSGPSPRSLGGGLHIDTSYGNGSPSTRGPQSAVVREGASTRLRSTEPRTAHPSSSTGAGLTRTPARRQTSARGIRERRSESRAARERMTEAQTAVEPRSSNNPWAEDMRAAKPTDLSLGNESQRQHAADQSAPTSASKGQASRDSQSKTKSQQEQGDSGSSSGSSSTPRQGGKKPLTISTKPAASIPPFSPVRETSRPDTRSGLASPGPASGSTGTPLSPRSIRGPKSPALSGSMSQNTDRTASYPPHASLNAALAHAPSTPSKAQFSRSSAPADSSPASNAFVLSSLERHRKFAEREAAAQSDRERLELFAEFVVNESRLRRDRYSSAFDAMAGDIIDLTRDMWRPLASGKQSSIDTSSIPPAEGQNYSAASEPYTENSSATAPSPASSFTNYTPGTEPDSPGSMKGISKLKGDSQQHVRAFEPSLSPIPSMAMSTAPEEEDSRGRSTSRWWEASAEGSTGHSQKLERTKRESKYMGLPREAREHLQWEAEQQYSPLPSGGTQTAGSSQSGEYPPEKTGWHDQTVTPSPSSFSQGWAHSAPATPDPWKLDVSRLVTLPPPYPRHYPAVNNNHPELTSIRTNQRSLSDLTEAEEIKKRYKEKVTSRHDQEKERQEKQRRDMRRNIQAQIQDGTMSFASAAAAESDFDAAQHRRTTELTKADFSAFKADVMQPLHAWYSERITKATACIDQIRSNLKSDARDSNPTRTQEEGDEQPELLERLTLLKWLFESREVLQKEMFELQAEQDELYRAVVVTPYRLVGNAEKVAEAEDFFARDKQDRRVAFATETLRRFEEFHAVVEENVTRGVEVQLSAFWDIAPGLLAVVQKVPGSGLEGFEIQIPPQEYEENPSYHEFPMQYLYSLLAHAQKSAYQFIESQINLLCLLHEVKTGVMTAGSRLLEMQRYLAGEDFASVDREMKAVRQDEEARLTVDLKEKVALVEGQWAEALGKGLGQCKGRVERFLLEKGGWDESLQE
ncbi:hypothetical protein EV356DRAFT_567561 [Viridothelium virens]|uniref:Uncharacterized protein n=1 Tax=Viridothelium virens TaxID=1048519 RepID=A0A6A6H7H2_VIRVR|nr:hypothetical protein EV356DRAFT_567561 [Viridothelium virens]